MLTDDKIIEMAEQEWSAGDTYIGPDIRSLTRFARLIEAKTREECAALLDESATPGPWKWYRWTDGYNHVVEEDGTSVTSVRHGGLDDSKYIAAANPETILHLIELVKLQDEALEGLLNRYMEFQPHLIIDECRSGELGAVQEALAKYKEMK